MVAFFFVIVSWEDEGAQGRRRKIEKQRVEKQF